MVLYPASSHKHVPGRSFAYLCGVVGRDPATPSCEVQALQADNVEHVPHVT
jgi:hypothetical protein